ATLELQQRYHDSYIESGLDVKSGGIETLTDWLRRGPFYHFAFDKDMANKSTEVQVNTVFIARPGVAESMPTNARCFICAHYRKTCQISTSNGLIVQVSTREV